jgi:hypothetical protein
MARQPHAGRAGHGGSGRDRRVGSLPKQNEPNSLPCNLFAIRSGIKGKDGDMLCTSKGKLALYNGTSYGDDVCQEWLPEKQLVLQEPTYPDSVLARHAVQERAVIDRVPKMVTSLEKQLWVIVAELILTPNDLNLLKKQMELENKLEQAKFKLADVVEVKTTANEGIAFRNSLCTYRERRDCLVRSRGKVYSLVLGQCTTVLLNKMKQDAD